MMDGSKVINFRKDLLLIVLCSLVTIPVFSAEKAKTPLEKGRAVAIKLCQACHSFTGANQAGTVGPPFVSMKARFPERKRMRDIIYDRQKEKPDTMMPPFGRHGFVNKKEMELLIDYLYTL